MFKKFILKIAILSGLSILGFQGGVEAADLHVVLVIDSYAQNLEIAMKCNYYMWLKEIQEISDSTDLDIISHIFIEDKANADFLVELDKLKVNEDDVILFYWAGHGYRTDSKDEMGNPWPSFSFDKDPCKGIDFLQLTLDLQKKNPRLLISIADTCNNYIRPEFLAPHHINMARKGSGQSELELRIKNNYKRLFCDARGIAMFAGSHPGQFSYAFVNLGNLFTISFLDAIQGEVRTTDEISWELIGLKAYENLEKLEPPEEQTPLIEMSLRYEN